MVALHVCTPLRTEMKETVHSEGGSKIVETMSLVIALCPSSNIDLHSQEFYTLQAT